jgi:hypothetical protein
VQKILTTAASLAAVVLFISAATTSPTTMPVLAAIGVAFVYFLVPAFMLMGAFARGLDTMLGKWLLFAAIAGPISGAVILAVNPSKLADERSMLAVAGVVWMVVFVPFVVWIVHRWRVDQYRPCPHCLASIPRRASRCRHCTAEVVPNPIEITPRH